MTEGAECLGQHYNLERNVAIYFTVFSKNDLGIPSWKKIDMLSFEVLNSSHTSNSEYSFSL